MIGLRDIALKCGVSIRTVTRALYGKGPVSPDTAELIRKAARELKYKPNHAARSLKLKRTYTIGLIRPRLDIEVQNKRFQVIMKHLDELGFTVLQGLYDDTVKLPGLITAFRDRCDGLIIHLHQEERHDDYLKDLTDQSFPYVLVDPHQKLASSHPCVCIDRKAGIVSAIKHLHNTGRKNICITMLTKISQSRIRGFIEGLESIGQKADPDKILYFDLPDGAWPLMVSGEVQHQTGFMEAGYRAGLNNKELGTRFDAVIGFDDKFTLGLLRALHERNIAVPEKLAVVGIDNDCYTAYTHVPLSTIQQSVVRAGHTIVDLLMQQIEDKKMPESVILPTEFIERQST